MQIKHYFQVLIAVVLVGFFLFWWWQDRRRSHAVRRDDARRNVAEAPSPSQPRPRRNHGGTPD